VVAAMSVGTQAEPALSSLPGSSPVSVRCEAVSSDKFEISVNVTSLSHEKVSAATATYDLFTIAGEPTTSREGWPDLPVIVRTVLIPPAGNPEVILGTVVSRIEQGFTPVPAPAPDQDSYSLSLATESAQQMTGFWPPNPVEVSEPAILRGYRILSVRIYPIQYYQQTGETKFNDQVDFELGFSGHGANEVVNPDKPRPSIYASRLIEAMALNPPAPGRDDILSGSYLYIVPRVNGVADAMAPLLDWRRRMGYRVAVAEVANNAQVAAIGDIIQDAYDSDDPPEFVCLVGDAVQSDIVVPAATQTGDYEYTRLDGDDRLPDIAIGRITVANLNQLNHVVDKIVSYETTPYMNNTEWFKRGGVVAGHQGNGLGEILLGKWVKKELLEYGFNEVVDWFWNEDGEMPQEHQWLTETFRDGISILHYRAYSHMNLIPLQVLTDLPNDEGMWPAVLAISCNTGNFVADQNGDYRNIGLSEEFLRSNGGGIGAIGTATPETNVRFNNLVAGGVWLGVYRYRQYCLGWGLVTGKYQIWQAYEGFDAEYRNFMDWNNLMGDPGTAIWTEVPTRLHVSHLDDFPVGTTRYDVRVLTAEGDQPLEGAQVCLWKGDEIHSVELTDDTGFAHFSLPPGDLSTGVMKLTVIKHNVYPYLADVTINQPPQQLLGIDSWSVDDDSDGESSGDSDGVANPGERVELRIALTNHGQADIQGQVVLDAHVLGEWAAVIDGPENLDQAPAPGESAELVYVVQVSPSCPDGEKVRLSLDISAGQATWNALASFETASPHVEVARVVFEGDTLVRGDMKFLDVELRNIGSKALANAIATISFDSPLITVVKPVASYQTIGSGSVGRTIGDWFRIGVHPLATPGSVFTLTLDLEDEQGFRDRTTAQIVLGTPGARDPFGPDAYGYSCYDSGDTSWSDRPTYEWIDVSGNGTRLNLNDQGDNQDLSVAINLPFAFQYYGQEFNRITVCSNGWAAFGEQAELANFRNQHIGQALCPNALLCPWWDNLIVPNGAGVFTRHDRNEGRFVIQWNNVQRLVEGGGGSRETFEIVLYNQQARPTRTGDGEILFQYRDIDNQNARAHNDIPFCTIGISDLDGLDGLEYTYWNTYVSGARTIADQMAIRFTTGTPFQCGVIQGRVTDAVNNHPMPGAQVVSSNGFWGLCDANGRYIIDDIIVTRNFSLTAFDQGFNDSTLTGFNIALGETLDVDFSLLHPEFSLSQNRFDVNISQGNSYETELTLSNRGNGTLTWETDKSVEIEDSPDPWDLMQSLHLGQIADDDRIEGAVLVGDRIYAAGANRPDPSMMYVFNLEGELVDQWQQVGQASFGMKDLEWDGDWIWGGELDTIYAYTPDGELATHWPCTFNPGSLIAWDSDRELLWIANTTRNIEAFTRDGRRTGQIVRKANDWRLYGLTYNPEDPTGKSLYILSRPGDAQYSWLMYRVNPDSGAAEFFHEIRPAEGGQTSGISITTDYDPLSWSLLAMANTDVQGGRDRLDIYHVQSRTDWMDLDPSAGFVESGNETDLTLTLNTLNLPQMPINGAITFRHNATGGVTELPIRMTVRGGAGSVEDRTWTLRRGWNTVSLNILPDLNDIPQLVRPLVDAGQLVLMKDGSGHFYRPANAFNNIPEYLYSNGYQLFMSEPGSLDIQGQVIAADEPIVLPAGWSLISYYPRGPLAVETALQGLDGCLIVAKDAFGKFYLPAFDFSNMSAMEAGSGYHVKLREQCEFSYPSENRLAVSVLAEPLLHYSVLEPGLSSFSLLVLGDPMAADWELAAYTNDGTLVGTGCFDEQGRCGIAIWGGEEESQISRMNEGEPIRINVWDGVSESDAEIELIEGELVWSSDGFAVARMTNSNVIPIAFGLEHAYPNPFNAQIKISYGIAVTGKMSLAVYDLSGRQIAILTEGLKATGRHQVTWSAEAIPTGVYLLRLESAGSTQTMKVALIR